jgi:hypothetical protein
MAMKLYLFVGLMFVMPHFGYSIAFNGGGTKVNGHSLARRLQIKEGRIQVKITQVDVDKNGFVRKHSKTMLTEYLKKNRKLVDTYGVALDASDTTISDRGLSAVIGCVTGLKELNLSKCKNLSEGTFLDFVTAAKIESFNFRGVNNNFFENRFLNYLRDRSCLFDHLKSLNLSSMNLSKKDLLGTALGAIQGKQEW